MAMLFSLLLVWLPGMGLLAYPSLDESDLSWLGQQIYHNECNQQPACLVSWNDGEDFPSLGIGHFIWYRQGQNAPFEQSFPDLLRFLETAGVQLPGWIHEYNYHSPWPHREAFAAADSQPWRDSLRSLLTNTTALQTQFIVERFEGSLEKMLTATAASNHEELAERFHAVANAAPPHGLYALIDYVNFKGEGVNPSERYLGRGWGLLQVLQAMPAAADDPLAAFAASAIQILEERVENAPVERNEGRWINGWRNRVNTYLPQPTSTSR